MNKEIDKNKVVAHIGGMLAELAKQPQVDPELILLYAGHRIQGGPLIDLYGMPPLGEIDHEDGYLVVDIALHQSKISLIELFPDYQRGDEILTNQMIFRLSNWCDEFLPSAEQMREESRMEAMIDAAEEGKSA